MGRWRYRVCIVSSRNLEHSLNNTPVIHRSAYPSDISKAIEARWLSQGHDASLLPSETCVATLVDVMFQASLLREEAEPVRCRLMVCDPETFDDEIQFGASRLQVVRFIEPYELTAQHVRKLAAAAGYYRALLAVRCTPGAAPEIWGLIATGTEWVNQVDAAGGRHDDLPDNLVIHCLGPGHLLASSGYARVVESANGRLLTEGFDPFRSKWLPERFGTVRSDLIKAAADSEAGESLTETTRMCDDFVRDLAQSVVRRTLRLVRTRGHGGMLVYLPDHALQSDRLPSLMRFRVQFEPDDSTARFRSIMLQVISRAQLIGQELKLKTVTYRDYRSMQDEQLRACESKLIDLAHFFADMMSVDGALILDRSFRLVGFGAEIMGDTHVQNIHRALDLEANETTVERADASGTRHRSAYRLVSGVPETVAVVVSQDGDVRFVANHHGKLTYWPYLP